MEPAYFVIAIFGCADGGRACTPVATLQTRYASEAQCSAAAPAALMDNSNFDYPTLVARCRSAGPSLVDSKQPANQRVRS